MHGLTSFTGSTEGGGTCFGRFSRFLFEAVVPQVSRFEVASFRIVFIHAFDDACRFI